MKPATTNGNIDKFVQLVNEGVEKWIEAGEIVSREIDNDPSWPDKVVKEHPEISEDTIYAFDRIGRKELLPKLLMSNKPGPKRLRRLPYSYQEKFAEQPVELLVQAQGEYDTLKVSIWNMTPDQARQAFDVDGPRTPQQQRAWMESRHVSEEARHFNEPFRVSGSTLVVLEPCRFSTKQLASILAQMTK